MSSQTEITILVHEWVTGGGLVGSPLPDGWAAEGAAIRRAVATDFASLTDPPARVIVTTDARLPQDPGPWTVVPIHEREGRERLLELARSVDVTILIAPETKQILAVLTRELEDAGCRHLGSSVDAVALTGDKARLAEHLRARSIDTPVARTIDPSAGLPADAEYPAVLKPVDGAGSQDTFLVRNCRRVPPGASVLKSAVLQAFVPGETLSASFLVDTTGRAWLIGIGAQCMAVVQGDRLEYQGGTIAVPRRDAELQLRPAIETIAGLLRVRRRRFHPECPIRAHDPS